MVLVHYSPSLVDYCIYSSITCKIFYQNKNSKPGWTLYTRAWLAKEMVFHNRMHHFLGYIPWLLSREKVKLNFILISNQKLRVQVIHKCMLYSNKYSTFKILGNSQRLQG